MQILWDHTGEIELLYDLFVIFGNKGELYGKKVRNGLFLWYDNYLGASHLHS